MLNAKETAKKLCMRFVYYGVCFIVSVLVFFMFLQVGINGFHQAKYEDMIYGNARKPYVYRALVPFTIRIVAATIPVEAKNVINEKLFKNRTFKRLIPAWRWEINLLTEYLIGCILMYLALVGFFFAFRYLFKTVYDAPDKLLDLTSLVALLSLPVMFKYTSFIYDFSTLFLFTLGLALMAQKKWMVFLLAYTLACFNKETTILLTMLFVIVFWFYPVFRLNKSLFVKILSAQMGIYLIVRLVLFYSFHHNYGVFLTGDIPNIHNLSMAPYSIEALVYLFISLMVLYKWEEKPAFLKCGLWILPPLIILCLFFGFLDELRDYYEAYPVVLLLMAHTMGDITGWKAKSRTIPLTLV